MNGRLILVVGNSCSGKDSIISRVKDLLPSVMVAKRFITRAPSSFESNYFVSFEDFDSLLKQGEFFLNWSSYGLNYGVSNEVLSLLLNGKDVLVNVSRNIIPLARELYHNTLVVFIKAPTSVIIRRIKSRAREDDYIVKARINRALSNQDCDYADFVIDNSGELSMAVNQLYDILKKL